MEQIKMENDFKWVLRVLNSSKTTTHIENSVKLFDLFISKWSECISDSVYELSYNSKFNNLKNDEMIVFFDEKLKKID